MVTSIQDKIKEKLAEDLNTWDARKAYISGNPDEWSLFTAKLEAKIAYTRDVLEFFKDSTLTYEEYLMLETIFTF